MYIKVTIENDFRNNDCTFWRGATHTYDVDWNSPCLLYCSSIGIDFKVALKIFLNLIFIFNLNNVWKFQKLLYSLWIIIIITANFYFLVANNDTLLSYKVLLA